VNITVHTNDHSSSEISVSVLDGSNRVIGSGTGQSDSPVTFFVYNPSLWSPANPNLYNVSITLGNDNVTAYTGFRTIEKGMVNGVTRPLLNGEFIFAFGTLE